ncbi:MAG: hypothetical protein WA364_25085 [Candidatus Nitrosopolaris sp.]
MSVHVTLAPTLTVIGFGEKALAAKAATTKLTLPPTVALTYYVTLLNSIGKTNR